MVAQYFSYDRFFGYGNFPFTLCDSIQLDVQKINPSINPTGNTELEYMMMWIYWGGPGANYTSVLQSGRLEDADPGKYYVLSDTPGDGLTIQPTFWIYVPDNKEGIPPDWPFTMKVLGHPQPDGSRAHEVGITILNGQLTFSWVGSLTDTPSSGSVTMPFDFTTMQYMRLRHDGGGIWSFHIGTSLTTMAVALGAGGVPARTTRPLQLSEFFTRCTMLAATDLDPENLYGDGFKAHGPRSDIFFSYWDVTSRFVEQACEQDWEKWWEWYYRDQIFALWKPPSELDPTPGGSRPQWYASWMGAAVFDPTWTDGGYTDIGTYFGSQNIFVLGMDGRLLPEQPTPLAERPRRLSARTAGPPEQSGPPEVKRPGRWPTYGGQEYWSPA